MGYRHIENSYKPTGQIIFLFKRCWALEKIHGTSAHITWKDGAVSFYSGGEKHDSFVKLFDAPALTEAFTVKGYDTITIFGEAYGGKQQGMAKRYGPVLKFVAFDVLVGGTDGKDGGKGRWLNVPEAEAVVRSLGLEFVHYKEVSTDLVEIDAERDAPSEQARRNGVVGDQVREGVVLRPLVEAYIGGARVMCKHKRHDERETKSIREVTTDPTKLQVLTEANAIAEEWVTATRLAHVLDKLPQGIDITGTKLVTEAMAEDVLREGSGEIVVSPEAVRAIKTRAVVLFKEFLRSENRF